MSENILVIAAHPDDEILGCGATMAKQVKNGNKVHVAILAEGITARDSNRDINIRSGELSELEGAARNANKIIGTTSLTMHNFPDNRMDSVDRLEVTKFIESLIDKIQPETIYTHHSGDMNIDHRVIHDAVLTASRPQPQCRVKNILFFEVPSSTQWNPAGSAPYFTPNWFEDISETLDIKLKALEEYKSEMRAWPHSRSAEAVQHLAKWRGASIGKDAAEAFMLGRAIRG